MNIICHVFKKEVKFCWILLLFQNIFIPLVRAGELWTIFGHCFICRPDVKKRAPDGVNIEISINPRAALLYLESFQAPSRPLFLLGSIFIWFHPQAWQPQLAIGRCTDPTDPTYTQIQIHKYTRQSQLQIGWCTDNPTDFHGKILRSTNWIIGQTEE